MVWCWHPVPKELESDVELSTLFPGTDPQVPQTTVSSLCSKSGSSFGFYFCLRNTFSKNRAYLLIWIFFLDIKRANGNNTGVILVTWVNLLSLFKQVRHLQPHSPASSILPSQQQSAGQTQCLANPAWSKANDKGKYPYQKKVTFS